MQDLDVQPPALLRFRAPDEFRSRPSFRHDVAPPGIRPEKMLASYRFEQPVSCGILGCTQLHDHGYLVQLADGTETNTGWDCGLDHFGFEFLPMRQTFDRVEREYSRRAGLRAVLADGARWREQLVSLQMRPHGGNWLLRNLRQFESLYPPTLLEVLRRHAEQGEIEVVVMSARAAGAPGALDAETTLAHSTEIPPARATVRGLRAFTLDTDNWPLFEMELELNEFLQLDADALDMAAVAQWTRWVEALDARLASFEAVIEEGKDFFRRGNLELLRHLAQDEASREMLSWIVFSSDFLAPEDRRPEKENFWQRNLKRLIVAINQ
jgi:hypothetical protein